MNTPRFEDCSPSSERMIPANHARLSDATTFVREFLHDVGCPQEVAASLLLCVEEIFVNIALYAYRGADSRLPDCTYARGANDEGGDHDCTVTIQCAELEHGLRYALWFHDHGKAFDPTSRRPVDINAKPEDRAVGGLGIFLIQRMMDVMLYERVESSNVIYVEKSSDKRLQCIHSV
ncbi:ATP-binding protein [Bifidobacterium sp.]|uniref:ATP-binding protein n=1 Tax=Bifidobacterium sp. TaxID=41200 RepID=UPI0039EA65FE